MSIDYDTLPIGNDWDGILLRELSHRPQVGQAGFYIYNSANWQSRFRRCEREIRTLFNGTPFPKSYHPGESCLGGCFAISRPCIEAMLRKGLFQPPFADIRGRIDLADDPWTTLLVHAAGFQIFDIKSMRDYGHVSWQSAGDWRAHLRRGLRVFNLGSISRNKDKTEELIARNFFRRARGEKRLLTMADGEP